MTTTNTIEDLLYQSGLTAQGCWENLDTYAQEAIIRLVTLSAERCIREIENYRIPCGNSAAGEMAAEWTYDALTQIRNDIWDLFGVDPK